MAPEIYEEALGPIDEGIGELIRSFQSLGTWVGDTLGAIQGVGEAVGRAVSGKPPPAR